MRINRQNLKWLVRMMLILLLVGAAEILVVLFVPRPGPRSQPLRASDSWRNIPIAPTTEREREGPLTRPVNPGIFHHIRTVTAVIDAPLNPCENSFLMGQRQRVPSLKNGPRSRPKSPAALFDNV